MRQYAELGFGLRSRAHSSVGRALPLQGNGRGFESLCAHYLLSGCESRSVVLQQCGEGDRAGQPVDVHW